MTSSKLVRQQFLRVAPISLFAVGAGHSLLYRLVYPAHEHRHDVLSSTGHGYFSSYVLLSLLVCATVLWYVVKSSYRQSAHGQTQPQAYNFWRTQSNLFLLQSIVFIFAEVGERAASSGMQDALSFFTTSLFSLGIVLQFVTAFAASAILRGSQVVGLLLAQLRQRPVASEEHQIRINPRVNARGFASSYFARGPPILISVLM